MKKIIFSNPNIYKENRFSQTIMIIPVRCFSCGKPVGHLWEAYEERVNKGEDRKKVLDDLGLERYCCRTTILGNVELTETAARFKRSGTKT